MRRAGRFRPARLALAVMALSAALAVAVVAGPALAEIRIGLAGPFSGPAAPWGVQMRRGAEAALRAVNAAGGIEGERVTLVTIDDAGDPRRGVEAAEALVDQGVVAVIGHFGSAVSIPASTVYAGAGIIQIVPAATSAELTEQGFNLLFRTSGRDDQQGSVAGAWLAATYAGQVVAVLHDRTTYGRALAEAAAEAMTAGGLEPVIVDAVDPGAEDYAAMVQRLADANVDAVYFGGLVEDGGRLLAAMRRAGVVAQFVAGDAFADWAFWQVAGASVVGTVVTTERDLRSSPAVVRLLDDFGGPDIAPGALFAAAYTYTAVELWARAARAAGTSDPWAVADAMKHAGTVETLSGPVAFDLRGDRFPPVFELYRWRDDGWLVRVQ